MRKLVIILFLVAGAPAVASAEPPSAADLLAEARGGDSKPAPSKASETPKDADSPAPELPAAPAEDPEAPNPFGAASVLFLGAGVVALGAWALQKWKLNRDGFTATTMSHVQSMRLGPKHQVSLVDVDGRQFLIGLAEGAITLLSEVEPGKRPPARAPSEPEFTWSEVFDDARNELRDTPDAAGTDGRVVNRNHVEAYRSAAHSGPGNIPRASEADSVVIALKRLENGGAS